MKHSDLQLDRYWDLTKASNWASLTAPATDSRSDPTRERETQLEHPKEKQKAFLKEQGAADGIKDGLVLGFDEGAADLVGASKGAADG